jgi:transcriptional regulator with XRE-family HTH domain
MTSYIDEKLIYESIGKKIKEFRENSRIYPEKITQELLARAIGVTRVSIANYETGKQSIYLSDLYKIADFLHVDVKEFLPSIDSVKLSAPEDKLEKTSDLTSEEKEAIKKLIGTVGKGGDDNER